MCSVASFQSLSIQGCRKVVRLGEEDAQVHGFKQSLFWTSFLQKSCFEMILGSILFSGCWSSPDSAGILVCSSAKAGAWNLPLKGSPKSSSQSLHFQTIPSESKAKAEEESTLAQSICSSMLSSRPLCLSKDSI